MIEQMRRLGILQFSNRQAILSRCCRLSSVSSEISPKRYTDTLNLPKSSFPMKHSRKLELDIERASSFTKLFSFDERPKSSKTFILHDGPPYANGDVHFGHAVNKILKDIFLKRKHLEGFNLDYQPGWDCHGLPIELKALTSEQSLQLSPLEIRGQARQLAAKTIENQKDSFSSWCISADWNRIYKTFDIQYSLAELNVFGKLHQDGLIFRDFMPVYWSPSTRTALAEAELQYNHQHVCKAVYAQYRINPACHNRDQSISALIWTTTPWTLPANEAIAFSKNLNYCLVSHPQHSDQLFLVAQELLEHLQAKFSSQLTIVDEHVPIDELSQWKYLDIFSDQLRPFLLSEHVSASKGGTGLVHVAPNHGFEDYKLFKTIGLDFKRECIVDERGWLKAPWNVPIIEDNQASLAILKSIPGAVVHVEDHAHSYPYDWRTSKPILVKPSSQWFFNIEPIRAKCLKALAKVQIYPEKLRKEFVHQVSSRPNWCISRQRNWGVPIPAFYRQDDREHRDAILTPSMFDSVLKQFQTHGCDVWWQASPQELLAEAKDIDQIENLVKGRDILDIWFDSGCSWHSVVGSDRVADMYLEGVDQIRGWFQSSLITSVALRGKAPYRSIFIHGFALDGEGHKMSKSVGNVIDPMDIVESRFNRFEGIEPVNAKTGDVGVDGLRWWIAQHACTHNDVRVEVKNFREDTLSTINRIRNTFRFLLGCLSRFDNPETFHVPASEWCEMRLIDRWMLYRLLAYRQAADEAYRQAQFGEVVEKSIHHLLHEVATFYLTRIKDRLYCESIDSFEVRSINTVLHYVYHTVAFQLAPIVPHIAMELDRHLSLQENCILHTSSDLDQFVREGLFGGSIEEGEEFEDKMKTVLQIIELLNKWTFANQKSSLAFDCQLVVGDIEGIEHLKLFQAEPEARNSDLVELLQVASCNYRMDAQLQLPLGSLELDPRELASKNEGQDICEEEELTTTLKVGLEPSKMNLCPRCRRYQVEGAPGNLCARCRAVFLRVI